MLNAQDYSTAPVRARDRSSAPSSDRRYFAPAAGFCYSMPCSVVGRLRDAPLFPRATHASFFVQELSVHFLIMPNAADQDHRQAWLKAQLAAPVTLIWTENRSSMLSAR